MSTKSSRRNPYIYRFNQYKTLMLDPLGWMGGTKRRKCGVNQHLVNSTNFELLQQFGILNRVDILAQKS